MTYVTLMHAAASSSHLLLGSLWSLLLAVVLIGFGVSCIQQFAQYYQAALDKVSIPHMLAYHIVAMVLSCWATIVTAFGGYTDSDTYIMQSFDVMLLLSPSYNQQGVLIVKIMLFVVLPPCLMSLQLTLYVPTSVSVYPVCITQERLEAAKALLASHVRESPSTFPSCLIASTTPHFLPSPHLRP